MSSAGEVDKPQLLEKGFVRKNIVCLYLAKIRSQSKKFCTRSPKHILFNKSLTLGYVQDDWKLARVTPLYKGNGCRNVLGNYRPISVISHVPKILQKYVNCMLNTYLYEHSLLYNDQFAYVKSQSTVNALHTLVDTTLYNINNSMLTGIVQLDLKKGFDTINHKILLYKLQKYGMSSNCLNWFESYLNNRKQIVKCNDKLSQLASYLLVYLREQF